MKKSVLKKLADGLMKTGVFWSCERRSDGEAEKIVLASKGGLPAPSVWELLDTFLRQEKLIPYRSKKEIAAAIKLAKAVSFASASVELVDKRVFSYSINPNYDNMIWKLSVEVK